MVAREGVENDVCARTAVEDVAEDVQLVDRQALYHVADGNDEIVGTTSRYDCVDDDVDIVSFVGIVCALVQQFLYDV